MLRAGHWGLLSWGREEGEGWEETDRDILPETTGVSALPLGHRARLLLLLHNLLWFGICSYGLNALRASSLPLWAWVPGPSLAQAPFWAPSVCLSSHSAGPSLTSGPQVGVVVSSWPKTDRR